MAIDTQTSEVIEEIKKYGREHGWGVTKQTIESLLTRLGVEASYDNILIVRKWLVEPFTDSEVKPDGREEDRSHIG